MNLQLRSGQVLALLGANGAGKSTAVSVMLGLCDADQGDASLLDQPPQAMAARRRIGVMLQSTQLPDTLKVGELLAMTRSYYPQPRAWPTAWRWPGWTACWSDATASCRADSSVACSSRWRSAGVRRCCSSTNPPPAWTSRPASRCGRAIRERAAAGCAVLLTTHYLEEAEALADHVVVMQAGRTLAEGSVEQIRERVLQRRIRCHSRMDEQGIAAWPGVRRVQRDGGLLEIQAEPVEPVVARLLAEDPQLSALEVHRAGLADAFLEITRAAEAA